ncbi:MAG: tRNA (adenosine(37)-N6)-threonylcarbamoyltransferase complex dimerization subunit type 1 TsaB [Gammaproteobacteria bacterium]|nr:tRNA (adenosine(37)-N6)-threonylcarbamoyltransferase complex dimerization subunit type 1 TsaB [Gammaproteobacteria bacterium]MBT4493995.1 tRNA (adenosine(37)-N6)-threonylcarbamoyltransferase complex dimerization subunit type 1 TsaB [Gammaproteobacteria bacterium]MBT7371812.1 tRNA (adenosine(37)-N6)-threonylcarbamoyltransferase complex dimerization subunit type 1 TsaB [Gammaproteobacteria bacterium]
MNFLAIDTSTSSTVLGLQIGERIIDRTVSSGRSHSRDILPSISNMVTEAGITLGELDALVFGQGPGSFTGLRIAAGVVQGLGYGLDIPVVQVSTLATLAQARAADENINVLVALLARAEEVYFGAYSINDGYAAPLAAEGVCDVSALPGVGSGNWYGIGNAWHLRDKIEKSVGVEFLEVGETSIPAVTDLLDLGTHFFGLGQVVSALEVTPVYLREQVASK